MKDFETCLKFLLILVAVLLDIIMLIKLLLALIGVY
jgi:hypothetical protein